MKLKNKWKRFWTLERRANHGFTLVELVVVIAILGILAGAGTAGYAGYVKSAKKKADQTLVANIVRAIETGTNSTMFTPPDSLAVSATTYPVGFIVLNADGGKTLTSTTTSKTVSGECEIVSNQILEYVERSNQTLTCPTNGCSVSEPVYTLKTSTVSYCKTHSNVKPQELASPISGLYVSSHSGCTSNGTDCDGCTGHTATANAWLTIAANATAEKPTLFIENIGSLDVYKLWRKCLSVYR